MNNDKQDKDLLLEELTQLARLGPVLSVGAGSNSVGKTLQECLGIEHSTTARNKKYGFTVTGTAQRGASTSRSNLFACVANWGDSKIKSSKELAAAYGRANPDLGYSSSLFCTTNALQPNGFGLILSADVNQFSLKEIYETNGKREELLTWDMTKISKKLSGLGNTAIIAADRIVSNSGENYFQFRWLEILGAPDESMFLQLIDEGSITVDHLISQRQGNSGVTEKGPLFKIRSDTRDQLYSTVERFDLLAI